MVAEFTERRQLILKLVVQEFVESAAAVASETLVRKYQLPVSPATVRNDLAALEDLGYLTHMHTSAGRVPTDAGYRFFVEHLMELNPLPVDEQQTIRRQFYQVRGELQQWIQVGAALLARTARNASVITPPQAYQSRFRHLELIAIHDVAVLLVLVLHDGTVKQQTLTLQAPLPQDELRLVSLRINEHCKNATVDEVAQFAQGEADPAPGPEDAPQPVPPSQLERHVFGLIVHAMHQIEDQVNRQIHSDGLIEMLSQPEFIPALLKEENAHRAVERMRQVLETLSDSSVLGTLILQALTNNDVTVIIGEEHGTDIMRDYSVVLARYGVEGAVAGVIGIIGPTRMAYPRSISAVRYISSVMSDLLGELYGGQAEQ